MTTTIMITGGHVTPALATIEFFQKQSKLNLVYVGRHQSDVFHSESIENKLIADLDIPIVKIDPLKLHRHQPWKIIFDLPKAIKSFWNIWQAFSLYKPNVVLSFGGYVALPVALIASLRRIPIVTHEQTLILGLANQIISKFAKLTTVSWEKTNLAPPNSVLTGNPLRKAFLINSIRPDWLPQTNKKVIYITGGSQGSLAINKQIFSILPSIAAKYIVVHQTGAARNQADFKAAQAKLKKLSPKLSQNYIPKKNLTANEVAFLMKKADLIISRSGANTITELIISKSKAILIPLPKSGRNEQMLNADYIKSLGLAQILDQAELSQLESAIDKVINKSLKLEPEIEIIAKLHQTAAQTLGRLVIKCANENSTSD